MTTRSPYCELVCDDMLAIWGDGCATTARYMVSLVCDDPLAILRVGVLRPARHMASWVCDELLAIWRVWRAGCAMTRSPNGKLGMRRSACHMAS